MRTTFTLLSIGAIASGMHAQPTLTFATNAPVVGTQYTVNYGDHVAPGAAGTSQTWDLSALTSDSTDVLELVAPSGTTNGAAFPTATVAELSSPVTTYYRVDATGIHFAGSDDGTSLIVNDPLPKYVPFPCTMGTTWSAPHAAEFAYDGQPVFRSGTVSGEADGYGTLIMPWGTVSDVLRIHLVNVMQDSLSLFTMDYTYDSYIYYVAGQSYPIAELVTATIDIGFGMPETVEFSRWTGELSTALDPIAEGRAVISAFPNPTNDVVNIVIGDDREARSSVTVLDAAGRIAHRQRLTAKSGSTAELDMSHLLPGAYTLVITDEEGVRSTARVIRR